MKKNKKTKIAKKKVSRKKVQDLGYYCPAK